jgi:hypothetical protein
MDVSAQNSVLIGLMKTWQRIKYPSQLFSPIDLWQRTKTVLVCFPDEYQQREAAELTVRDIVEAYPQKHFYILTTRALPERWLNVELIRLRKEDLNLFSLPNTDFIKYLQDKSIDTMIDLWPTFNLTNAYIGRRCGAPLRIGFGSEHASAFYNLLVVPVLSEGFLAKQYDAMTETILNLEGNEGHRG